MNAIKEAKDNIGDYKLKTADDYVVPEDQRVNAEIKLMQLLQLLDQVSELCIILDLTTISKLDWRSSAIPFLGVVDSIFLGVYWDFVL